MHAPSSVWRRTSRGQQAVSRASFRWMVDTMRGPERLPGCVQTCPRKAALPSARASERVSTAPPCARPRGPRSPAGLGGWGTLDCRHRSFRGRVLCASRAGCVDHSVLGPSLHLVPDRSTAHAVSWPRLAPIAHCSVSSSGPYPLAHLNGYPPRLHVRGQACVLQVRAWR
jgi:hypothetical protein